jgi:hypothetical protein
MVAQLILWDGEPPQDDNTDGALAFVVLAFVMYVVVVAGMILR